jgi:CHAT domain-containing protein
VGDEQAAMGLAGAAVQAGAVSVLASLWQVEDVGTAALMSEFYTGLRSGKSKSDALRAAQLSMIERGGSSADPWVWAAFAMLGGWR